MPSKLLSLGKSSGKWGFMGLSALARLFVKHWYLFFLIIFLLPQLITSIQTAYATQNPIHPFLESGKSIFTADVKLGEDTILLQENPAEFYGKTKPTEGIWQGVKYKWTVFIAWFKLIGLAYLIFVPLILIYRVTKYRNLSETNKNITLSIFFFVLYLFIVNIIFVMYKLVTGAIIITLPEGITEFQQMWLLFKHLLPLNGLVTFIKYIVLSIVA